MKKEKSAIAWLMEQAGDKKFNYVLSVILAGLGVLCFLIPYFVITKVITNLIEGNKDLNTYLILLAIIVASWLLRVLFHALSTATSHKATFNVIGQVRKKCCDKLSRMPLGDVKNQAKGSLKSTIVERIDSIETTLAHIVPEFTTNLLVPLVLIVYLFVLDWRMALASLITLPIGFLCYMCMMIGYKPRFTRAMNATKNLNDTSVEYINGLKVIKVFSKTESSYKRFKEACKEGANSYIDWMRQSNVFFTFAMNVTPATMLSILPIGCLLYGTNGLDLEKLIMVIILGVALITPLITCMSYSDDIAQIGVITKDIRTLLGHREMIRPDKLEYKIESNDISFTNVSFGYDDKEIIHNVSLNIKEGSYVALVGPSGSGKTTIARLIASLWDTTKGSITLGNVDIKNIPLDYYNEKIAFVTQENFLFNLSIMDNIKIGSKKEISDEEVINICKECGCHDFIMGLENGYNTIVGSQGGHLSGGERQRITIARAMLKDAPIIIFDEATAYTDPESEALIQNSVAKLVKDKTLIVIAHRLSTIKNADNIYVIKDGMVFEEGTHEALLANNSLYKEMWESHISVSDEVEEAIQC